MRRILPVAALVLMAALAVELLREAPPPVEPVRTETDPVVPGNPAVEVPADDPVATKRLIERVDAEPDLDRLREQYSVGGLVPDDADLRLEYRRPFILALGRSADPAATRFLIDRFDEEIGHLILVALEGRHTAEVFGLRRRVALTAVDPGLRKTALAPLAADKARRDEAIALCTEVFSRDPDLEVRKQALQTLAGLGARSVLESALNDPNPHIRQAARTLLDAEPP